MCTFKHLAFRPARDGIEKDDIPMLAECVSRPAPLISSCAASQTMKLKNGVTAFTKACLASMTPKLQTILDLAGGRLPCEVFFFQLPVIQLANAKPRQRKGKEQSV